LGINHGIGSSRVAANPRMERRGSDARDSSTT
jgi:hypothetical protein